MKFSWTDIDEIAYQLTEHHGGVDPTAIKFTDLRKLVEGLEGFAPEPGQSVNEQILEAIQQAWIEEREDAGLSDTTGEDDEDDDGYAPNNPFR
ncbi:MAG: Fe-S cluster assembly protein IscX [Phycisphaerales bacterium JB063]